MAAHYPCRPHLIPSPARREGARACPGLDPAVRVKRAHLQTIPVLRLKLEANPVFVTIAPLTHRKPHI